MSVISGAFNKIYGPCFRLNESEDNYSTVDARFSISLPPALAYISECMFV